MFSIKLILVQRLVGQQKTVIQHVKLPKEGSIQFYLAGKPGFLPTYKDHGGVYMHYH